MQQTPTDAGAGGQIQHGGASRYANLVEALVKTGDFDGAEQIVHTLAPYYDSLFNHAQAMAHVARTVAEAGDFDRAEQIAHAIDGYPCPVNALAQVAALVASAGDYDRAEQIAHAITHDNTNLEPGLKAEAMVQVAGACAEAGESRRATHLLRDAEQQLAVTTTHHDSLVQALACVVQAVAKAGDFDRAEQIAHTIDDHPDPHARSRALADIAAAAAETGDLGRVLLGGFEESAVGEQGAGEVGEGVEVFGFAVVAADESAVA